jgi:hypothetical protein
MGAIYTGLTRPRSKKNRSSSMFELGYRAVTLRGRSSIVSAILAVS